MKKIKSFILIFVLTIIAIIPQTGCKNEEPVSKTSYYLDTICSIDIYGFSKEEASSIIDQAFKLCSHYEDLLSKTVSGSDIYRINHSKGKAVKVDGDTVEVIKKAIYYGDLSGGKFDVTIGKVTDLWDFHSENPKVPSKDKVSSALSHVDYKKIKIEGNTVTLLDPEMEIDLGGIAKGYICDKVVQLLKDKQVQCGVVNLGGNIATIGLKNGNTPFKVGIERPYSDRKEIVGTIETENKTLVTSGIYERCFEVDGERYHHILDVNTGFPAKSQVESVTIIAELDHSVDCDGLSTLCLVLGAEEGKALIESIDGVEAVFIDKDDKIVTTENANFKEK